MCGENLQTKSDDLDKLLENPKDNMAALTVFLDAIVEKAIREVNVSFAVRRLAKLDTSEELLPKARRQLSSYRTRLGTIIEYAVSSEIDRILRTYYEGRLSLTFVVAHEYPDFYLRGIDLKVLSRLEMKAVENESDEQAARCDFPTEKIDPDRDFVLFMGWEWKKEKSDNGVCWEHPFIFAHVLVPAVEIARERDLRLFSIGGKIEDGSVLVPSTKERGKMVPDPGNYGKFWRIVKRSRWRASDLSSYIKKFLKFQKVVDDHSPRKRMKRYKPD